MEEFLHLYLNKDGNFDSFLVLPLLMYANAGLFMWDFYHLVKKKTQWETLSVMLLPWAVSLIGGVMLAIFVNIPASNQLDVFAKALENRQLSWEILGILVVYVFLWGITLVYQHQRKRNIKKWLCSYIPDYLYVLVVISFPIYYLITGDNLFFILEDSSTGLGFDFNIFLYVYLYVFMLLACKILLLMVGLFVCFYSQKITCYKYKENKNPVRFFLIYEMIFQNALLRGMLMFWITLLTLLAVPLVSGGEFWDIWFMWLFFLLGGIFCVLLIIRPIVNTYQRFKQWGDRKRLIELFCREYFLEPHVSSGKDYVITKHFLVDEQSAAGIYYWEELIYWSRGWTSSKQGWVRQLRFSDGQICEFVKGEQQVEEIFRYAAMYEESRGLKDRAGAFEKEQKPEEESLYSKVITYVMVIAIAIIFSISMQV